MNGDQEFNGRLQRLDSEAYRGQIWVHWTMTIDQRKTGWLNSLTHAQTREALLHALSRYDLVCSTYCLMPDHGHFLIGGVHSNPSSDQRLAIQAFRKEWNRQLKRIPPTGTYELQKQAHDHILRKHEYASIDAFKRVAGYILENPVKAGLVENFHDWEFQGCLIPGYPDLNPRDDRFWDVFWKIYDKLIDGR